MLIIHCGESLYSNGFPLFKTREHFTVNCRGVHVEPPIADIYAHIDVGRRRGRTILGAMRLGDPEA
jgi:hypothetical protein